MNYIKLLFLLVMLLTVSCVGVGIDPDNYCSDDSDCEGDSICLNTSCGYNPCTENICGKGKCIPGSLHDGKEYIGDYGKMYHCECYENAVMPEGSILCIPTCDGYSEECTEFGLRCNMEKGRCDTICQGEGSCPEGYTCTGACRKITD